VVGGDKVVGADSTSHGHFARLVFAIEAVPPRE
jgi:hypothetical protein